MYRYLTAGLMVTALNYTLSAQTPQQPSEPLPVPVRTDTAKVLVFEPVASTGNLLTSHSRRFWVTVFTCYRVADSVNRMFTGNVGHTPMRVVRLAMFGSEAKRDSTDRLLAAFMPWLTERPKSPKPATGSTLGLAP